MSDDRATVLPFDSRRFERLDVTALLSMVKAATTIENQLEAVLRESGSDMRANEWDALILLGAYGPMRPSELLRHTALSVSPGTLHAILGRLEDRGFIARTPHPNHRRGVIHGITAEGLAAIEDLWPAVERHIVHRFAGHFSDDELRNLRDLGDRMA